MNTKMEVYLIKTRLFATSKLLMPSLFNAIVVGCRRRYSVNVKIEIKSKSDTYPSTFAGMTANVKTVGENGGRLSADTKRVDWLYDKE